MKARKIISFCSMFSLVLILSVYYVLSPIDRSGEVVSNVENEDSVNVEVLDGETAYFNNLDVLKETVFLEELKALDTIVASKETSSEEKIAALNTKNDITKINEKEKELVKVIKDKGYENAYVEYENNNINILVSKKDPTAKDAENIISSVYPLIDKAYTPLVTFKV